MASGFVWETSPTEELIPGYQEWAQRFRVALFRLLQFHTPQIEAWMKASASWTDRTGNARQSLTAEVQHLLGVSAVYVIELRYGNQGNEISYAKYLENANAGKYSILRPAVDHWAPILLNAVRRMLLNYR